jgi:predicted GNAT superfamily acetyltransferase
MITAMSEFRLTNDQHTSTSTLSNPVPDVTIRRLQTHEDYKACVALQKATWGETFSECVPPSILMVSQKIGGVAAGAFDEKGTMLGFVFGLTGVKDGRLVHWSDMLAVRPEARDLGIGRRLKLYQRELLRMISVEVVYWTYDPLVARNAHLNLNRLGARVTEYIPDMYENDSPGELYQGLSMDRFIVEWHILEERAEGEMSRQLQMDAKRFSQTPIVNAQMNEAGIPMPQIIGELPKLPAVRVEIPADIQILKSQSMPLAIEWRATTRRAFLFYQEHGYRVTTFYRDEGSGRCFYGIKNDDQNSTSHPS